MIRASERAGKAACRVGGKVVLLCTAALMMWSAAAFGAEQPESSPVTNPLPWVTMSLKSLGVPSIPSSFIQVGSSMLTLDLVDDTHLLLTFSSRGLVPRVPNDPPDDEDRMVAAELVELPTAKILARTEWHMHDHGRYLWRLGKGRFLVRTRHELFVITPRARLNTNDPLRPMAFPTREGHPVFAVVSPDKEMVMVETIGPKKKGNIGTGNGGVIVTDPRPVVMIDFFRVSGGDEPDSPMKLTVAGVVKAPAPMLLPMDADGYLWPGDGKHGAWPVSFNEFGGREVKIANVESSCPPRLQMVSRFEFLAFTCKGSDSRVHVKSYGMDGHETWEDTLSGTYGIPELTFAPDAGRFALSRIISPSGDLNLGSVIPEGATQEVRVYQTESGNVLLKVPTSPVTRYAENFDLAENGLVAAVVNAGVIEIYKLPSPSAQDLKDLAEAKSFSPPASQAPVNFARLETHGDGNATPGTPAAARDVASAMRPDVASTPGMGGGIAPPAPTAPPLGGANALTGSAASSAATTADPNQGGLAVAPSTTQGDLAVAPPGAEVTKPRVAGNTPSSTDNISDAEALAALAKTHSSMKAGSTATIEPTAKTEPAAKTVDSGNAGEGPRKPPTLLEPGENVEKAKSPGQR